jgi:hypothetical protein
VESNGGMILTGKTEELGEKLSLSHFFQHKFHIDRPGNESGLPR